MFSCFGIKVNKVTKGPHAAIQNLKMWREPGTLELVPVKPECPDGYKQGGDGYCYKFHPESKNWQGTQSM